YSFAGNVYRGPLPVPVRHDLVLSLQHSTLETNLAVDLYFATEGTYLFGLALLSFQAEVALFGDFRFAVGLDVATDTGWQRLIGELKYTFNVYGL
ncbi:MAG: hypothetical protein ABID40_06365, partial [Candidatus Bipolaricaulota bacterium]